jgi:predicted O-methyltransferase YrrM
MKILSYKKRLTVSAERDGSASSPSSFNDADKEYYARVLDMAPSHLYCGGLFITDNIL